MKQKGRIKSYDPKKRYGFIVTDNANEKDTFFHQSNVITPNANIQAGKSVAFRVGPGKKGFEAKEIEILD